VAGGWWSGLNGAAPERRQRKEKGAIEAEAVRRGGGDARKMTMGGVARCPYCMRYSMTGWFCTSFLFTLSPFVSKYPTYSMTLSLVHPAA
jgi:hypothetical protein